MGGTSAGARSGPGHPGRGPNAGTRDDERSGTWAPSLWLMKPLISLTDFEAAYINNQSGPYSAHRGL